MSNEEGLNIFVIPAGYRGTLALAQGKTALLTYHNSIVGVVKALPEPVEFARGGDLVEIEAAWEEYRKSLSTPLPPFDRA